MRISSLKQHVRLVISLATGTAMAPSNRSMVSSAIASRSPQGLGQHVWRLLILMVVLCILGSLAIAAWPAHQGKSLVGKDAWLINGQAFQNTVPQRDEVDDGTRRASDTVYWRTWSPDTLGTVAEIRTKPFKPSQFMAIPYGGFAGDGAIQLQLTCPETGAHLTLANARTNTQFTETLVRLPPQWCPGDVVLLAYSHLHTASEYIEVGTPFTVSRIEYYKGKFVGNVGLFAVIFAFAWSLIFLPHLFFTLRGTKSDWLAPGLICIGLFGYAMFFVFFFSHHLGQWLSVIALLSAMGAILWSLRYRREAFLKAWTPWKTPTLLWGAFALAAFCLAFAADNGAGPWSTNARFTPVQWSTDNQLPMQISEYLFRGYDPRTLNLGPWKISDRPPLAYGLMAVLRVPSWLIASHSNGYALYFQYELMAGIIINGLWVTVLYYLLSALQIARRERILLALVVGLTPFVIFNSVYIWPKMLGAAFALLAFVKLFEPSSLIETRRYQRFGPSLISAALLSGLALLSHGGTAFGVIAAILVAVCYRGFPSLSLSIRAGFAGALLLIPWVLWQHFEQPPGNALVKYAFSGNFGFGEEQKSVLDTIRAAYAPVTFSSWLDGKVQALNILMTGHNSTCGVQESAPILSRFGFLRVQDFFYFGPSLRFLALGFLPIIFGRWVLPETIRSSRTLHFIRVMVGTGMLSIGLYALAGFDCFINHMQSYQAMLEIITGLALALYSARRWYFDLVLVLSAAYAIVVWIVDPLTLALRVSIPALCVLAVLGILCCYRWYVIGIARHTD